MAQIDMVPVQLNVTVPGAPNNVTQVVLNLKTSAGANIATTGGAFSCQIVPSSFPMNSETIIQNTPAAALLSYASGISVVTLTLTSSGLDAGSYKLAMFFTPSGGDIQLCGQGTLQVS